MKIAVGLALLLLTAPVGWAQEVGHEGHDHAAATGRGQNNVDYFWLKSDEAFHAGDFERAIQLHRAIVALEPDDVESYGVAAWLMWSLGRGDEAVAHIERGLKANPDNPAMWDAAGQQFDLQKLFARSHQTYSRAVELTTPDELKTSDAMMLRRRLAHAAEHAGDLAASVAAWRALKQDFPTEAVHANNLARVEKLLQDAPPARAALPLAPLALGAVLLGAALAGKARRG